MPIRLTPAQAARAGITDPMPTLAVARGSHAHNVQTYSDELLEAVIADLGSRNLRNLRDHETRWSAERCKAARAERRQRKEARRASH